MLCNRDVGFIIFARKLVFFFYIASLFDSCIKPFEIVTEELDTLCLFISFPQITIPLSHCYTLHLSMNPIMSQFHRNFQAMNFKFLKFSLAK